MSDGAGAPNLCWRSSHVARSSGYARLGANAELLFPDAEALLPGHFSRVNSLLQMRTLSRRQTKVTDWTREKFGTYNNHMPTNQCLRNLDHSALGLHDLNLLDTSWSAINYNTGIFNSRNDLGAKHLRW